MKVLRPTLALGALLALGGCDTQTAPPPSPIVVSPPHPPLPPVVVADPSADFPRIELPRSTSMAADETDWLSLTGPLHPAFTDRPGSEWRFMDTANSSSSRAFFFSGNPGTYYKWVQFVVVWYPTNTNQKVRLCYAYSDSVPPVKDWLEIAVINAVPRSPGPGYPAGWSVRPDTTNEGNDAATAFFNRMVQEKRDVYVGWQVYGDNSPMELTECRLTFWKEALKAGAA